MPTKPSPSLAPGPGRCRLAAAASICGRQVDQPVVSVVGELLPVLLPPRLPPLGVAMKDSSLHRDLRAHLRCGDMLNKSVVVKVLASQLVDRADHLAHRAAETEVLAARPAVEVVLLHERRQVGVLHDQTVVAPRRHAASWESHGSRPARPARRQSPAGQIPAGESSGPGSCGRAPRTRAARPPGRSRPAPASACTTARTRRRCDSACGIPR